MSRSTPVVRMLPFLALLASSPETADGTISMPGRWLAELVSEAKSGDRIILGEETF